MIIAVRTVSSAIPRDSSRLSCGNQMIVTHESLSPDDPTMAAVRKTDCRDCSRTKVADHLPGIAAIAGAQRRFGRADEDLAFAKHRDINRRTVLRESDRLGLPGLPSVARREHKASVFPQGPALGQAREANSIRDFTDFLSYTSPCS